MADKRVGIAAPATVYIKLGEKSWGLLASYMIQED